MTMAAAGVAKLIEECGELQQVLGKKLAWWHSTAPHWDGTDLHARMEEEMGDVLAAIDFVAVHLRLDAARIRSRANRKTKLFDTWQKELNNNDNGIDASIRPPDKEALRDLYELIMMTPGWAAKYTDDMMSALHRAIKS